MTSVSHKMGVLFIILRNSKRKCEGDVDMGKELQSNTRNEWSRLIAYGMIRNAHRQCEWWVVEVQLIYQTDKLQLSTLMVILASGGIFYEAAIQENYALK